MRKLLRSLAPLVLLAVAAAGLTACDVHIGPYAAIVDGKSISQQTLQDALSSAASDSGYICSVTSDYQAQIRTYGTGSQTYDSEFVGFVLATLVRAQLAADLAATRGLRVTSLLSSVATTQIDGSLASNGCTGSATKNFAALSPAMRSAYLTLYENLDLLGAAQDGVTLTTQGLAQYATSNPTAAQLTCLSFIQAPSTATAQQAETALAGGTSFDAEAAKCSTGSSDSVGCPSLSQLPAQISAPVAQLAIGSWTAPIAYQGSYLILKETSRQTASGSQLLQIVIGNAENRFSALLGTLDQSSSVQIDPAYGTWTRASASGTPIGQPAAPPDKFLLSPQAVVPPYVASPVTTTTTPGA